MSTLRSTASRVGPRPGRPPQTDERDFFLPLMRQAGRAGVYKLHFLQGTGPLGGRVISQVARLVCDLEREGYVFEHRRPNKDRGEKFCTYVLVAEPIEPRHRMDTEFRRALDLDTEREERRIAPQPSFSQSLLWETGAKR